ncbi:tRNA (adenosine(37)-N6)-dimethylallyltransferase MiaA [Candidatus Uhrbacteria bacterium]|nr:tRNA (adenosine(37)-N6)-dimethylallyltransferase MiaA [Candidatus Uhrbacteria bacterium]
MTKRNSTSYKLSVRGGPASSGQATSSIPLVVIVGPTGSGKSDLAIALAKKFNGEVVSADSRQVYRGLDLGSGKVTKKEQKRVAHHLLDIATPGRRFSVAQFKKKADRAIADIWNRGKLPLLVGGSHLYIKAVTEGYSLPHVKPDAQLRKQLEEQSLENLLVLLKKFDRATYNRTDKKNPRRIIRALEVIYHTGKPIPPLKKESLFSTLILGIDVQRERLYKRIDERVDTRVKRGMIAEVKNLIMDGVSKKWLKRLGLEYQFITEYLEKIQKLQATSYPPEADTLQAGKLQARRDSLERLKYATHDFARRQLTWYRKEKRIQWIRSHKEAFECISSFLHLV